MKFLTSKNDRKKNRRKNLRYDNFTCSQRPLIECVTKYRVWKINFVANCSMDHDRFSECDRRFYADTINRCSCGLRIERNSKNSLRVKRFCSLRYTRTTLSDRIYICSGEVFRSFSTTFEASGPGRVRVKTYTKIAFAGKYKRFACFSCEPKCYSVVHRARAGQTCVCELCLSKGGAVDRNRGRAKSHNFRSRYDFFFYRFPQFFTLLLAYNCV